MNQAAMPTGAEQRAVLIVGAGRSGTSVLARGIQALGVELGADFKRATAKNPTGFFEDAELLALSKRVRRALGLRADSVALIEDGAWQGAAIRELQNDAVSLVRRRFSSAPVWGFKYGRTLRILPFWEPVFASLKVRPGYVLALRNPVSVARSRARMDPRRGRQEKSDLEWLVGIVPYFRLMRGRPLAVVDYDSLVADPAGQLTRVARSLGLQQDENARNGVHRYASEFLDPALRHNRVTDSELANDPRLLPVTRDAYLLLRRLAIDEWRVDADEFWRAWEAIEKECARMGPLLALTDRLEAEYRAACWNPAGMLSRLRQMWRDYRN